MEVTLEMIGFIAVSYLFAKLNQDVIKFPHQMVVDGLCGADVFEFQEQVKGRSRRAQCFKRLIDDVDGLFLNRLSRHRKESASQ